MPHPMRCHPASSAASATAASASAVYCNLTALGHQRPIQPAATSAAVEAPRRATASGRCRARRSAGGSSSQPRKPASTSPGSHASSATAASTTSAVAAATVAATPRQREVAVSGGGGAPDGPGQRAAEPDERDERGRAEDRPLPWRGAVRDANEPEVPPGRNGPPEIERLAVVPGSRRRSARIDVARQQRSAEVGEQDRNDRQNARDDAPHEIRPRLLGSVQERPPGLRGQLRAPRRQALLPLLLWRGAAECPLRRSRLRPRGFLLAWDSYYCYTTVQLFPVPGGRNPWPCPTRFRTSSSS